MDMFNIVLSEVPIEIQSRYNQCRCFCRDYLRAEVIPAFSAFVSDEKLKELRMQLLDVSDEILERDALYSEIASKMPYFDRMVLHGACISYKKKGYLFTACSGTGKSTHIRLWRQYIGEDVDIVNGDKPIFHVAKQDGEITITAYDTPWCGKEGWNRKHNAQMEAICFIRRSEDGKNRIRKVDVEEAVPLMLRQMYHPYEPEATGRMLELFDQMMESLPFYLLECDMSEDAVRCSFEALTGEEYVSRGIQATPEEINRLWRMPE